MIEKATHVTISWNLARNPEKISSKICRKNAKFEFFAIELVNIHEFNRKKKLAIFDEKIEIRERYSRLRRPPLCPRPLRAPSLYGAPSGVFRSACPATPELRLSLDRCRQAASGFCFFAKFSSRVQGSTRLAFFCDFEHLVTSPLG